MGSTPPTWENDVTDVSRWHLIEVYAKTDEGEVLLLRRILGWDKSPLPDWVEAVEDDHILVKVAELPDGISWNVRRDGSPENAVSIDGVEVRRLEPWMDSFLDQEPSVDQWGLGLPCVVYEAWCTEADHRRARDAMLELPEKRIENLRDIGILPTHTDEVTDVGGPGYAGSTIIHVPQVRPFVPGIHSIALPDGPDPWGELSLVSTTLDGPVELGSAAQELALEPARDLDNDEALRYLEVYCPDAELAELNEVTKEDGPDYIARLPEKHVVGVGADVQLILLPKNGAPVRLEWGLVKGIGYRLKTQAAPGTKPAISDHLVRFSEEPWAERVPQFGHSPPVDIHHVPPGNPQDTFERLRDAGSTMLLCDPYVSKNSLEKVIREADSCKLLTTQAKVDEIGKDWLRRNDVEVCVITDDAGGVHDRFLLGDRRGFVIGTSLTGLGHRHSFVIEADNRMKWVLREVFEELWEDAPSAA